MPQRIDRLNSLLKQVIAEVIMTEVRNPKITALITVRQVEVSKDLQHAKVFVSLLGSPSAQQQTLKALRSAAGFISVKTAQQVILRRFPSLSFHLDETLDHELRIHTLLEQIHHEQNHPPSSE